MVLGEVEHDRNEQTLLLGPFVEEGRRRYSVNVNNLCLPNESGQSPGPGPSP